MRSASVVVVASGSTRWPGLEAKVNPMNINQPRILAVAALLALAGLAVPANAQVNPEDCIDGAIGPFPFVDPTCLEDAQPLPEGCDPTDTATFPQEACGLPGPAALDGLCALNPAPVDPTFPGCLVELVDPSAVDQLCALNPDAVDPTFPNCIVELVDAGAVDQLCAVNPEAADPTFPGCLSDIGVLPEGCAVETPDGCMPEETPDLNALCALNEAALDPTFPACILELAPGGLPEGCDPSGEGFPQAECGVPAPGGLDDVCATLVPEAVDPTFPACILELVPAGLPASTPVVTIEFDALATQLTGNMILITGTATSDIDASDVTLSILNTAEVTPDDCIDGAVFFPADDAATGDLEAGTGKEFRAQVSCDSEQTGAAWEVTATFGADEVGAGTVQVDFDSTTPTTIDVNVTDVDGVASIGALTSPVGAYTPDGLAVGLLAVAATVIDQNGNGEGGAEAGRIVDSDFAATITQDDAPSASDDVLVGAVFDEADAITSTFPLTYNLPSRLKDGDYTVTASYTNAGSSVVSTDAVALTVSNVAPDITAVPAIEAGQERVAGSVLVAASLDDLNFGSLDAAAVTELESLSVAVKTGADCATGAASTATGLALSFPTDAGGVAGAQADNARALDLTAVASSAALAASVQLDWDTSTDAGTYLLCATLADEVASDADVLLATVTLVAINDGFHVTLDDGGDGLQVAGSIAPGAGAVTETLRVAFTGTTAGTTLDFTIGQFVRSTGGPSFDFTAGDVQGFLCNDAAGTDCGAANIDLVFGVADLPAVLGTGIGFGAGQQVFVVFEFVVPSGTAAGSYSAPVNLVAS